MRSRSRSTALALLVIALPMAWLGCSGGSDIVAPTEGTLEITTTTSGDLPDPDGYAVSLDGEAPAAIETNGRLSVAGVSPGTHLVELSGVADNCTVTDGEQVSVVVRAGEVAVASFAVTCPAPPSPTGTLTVATETTGEEPDPDGYAVSVDGDEGRAIGINATLSLPDLTPGDHSIGLTGIAANCTLEGDNPRPATVVADAAVAVTFVLTCDTPPPATGSLQLTVATSGPDPDPDGYTFSIDDGNPQAIGVNATVTVANLAAGSHALRLAGVAGNCAVGGDNPRPVTVPAGGAVQVSIAVTCSAGTGSVTVTTTTTGSPTDSDGYSVSVDGGAARPVGVNASVTISGLEPGDHSVQLAGLAANCTAQGANPRQVAVQASATATTTFTVVCAATTGALTVTISGLPNGLEAAVTVTGPGGFSRRLTATRTLNDLAPGDYTITASEVASGGTTYTASPAARTVAVAAGATATATVTYGPAAGPSLNLRIDGVHLTQGVQASDNSIPWVTGRDGFIRIFVLANETNTAAPSVRVRLYRNGALTNTIAVPAPGSATPTVRDENRLASSWNVQIPGAQIGPGLAVLAEVDPGNQIAEKNESDNSFPASGVPQPVEIRSAPVLGVRFVPVRQGNGLQGDITDANRARYLDLSRRLFPLPSTEADIHTVYTTSENLQPDDGNGAWGTVLSEIDALRVAEGTGRHYYGVVRLGYASGIVGLGYVGRPTAVGYDDAIDRGRVVAHELGHTWNRLHAPCGGPSGVDPDYPYPGGAIGVYGLHLREEVLKLPTLPDIMGYCEDPWISDYTYRAVLAYRAAGGAESPSEVPAARAETSLLIWGRIENGRPVLEPAFELLTRPSLPREPGPYTVEGIASDGSRVFHLSFDATAVADGARSAKHFAFAVPLRSAPSARLGRLRLSGPTGTADLVRVEAAADPTAAARPMQARRSFRGARLSWDASRHPVIMVRDPDTGEVLSFARGGEAELVTGRAALDLIVSDGVGSRRLRLPVEDR